MARSSSNMSPAPSSSSGGSSGPSTVGGQSRPGGPVQVTPGGRAVGSAIGGGGGGITSRKSRDKGPTKEELAEKSVEKVQEELGMTLTPEARQKIKSKAKSKKQTVSPTQAQEILKKEFEPTTTRQQLQQRQIQDIQQQRQQTISPEVRQRITGERQTDRGDLQSRQLQDIQTGPQSRRFSGTQIVTESGRKVQQRLTPGERDFLIRQEQQKRGQTLSPQQRQEVLREARQGSGLKIGQRFERQIEKEEPSTIPQAAISFGRAGVSALGGELSEFGRRKSRESSLQFERGNVGAGSVSSGFVGGLSRAIGGTAQFASTVTREPVKTGQAIGRGAGQVVSDPSGAYNSAVRTIKSNPAAFGGQVAIDVAGGAGTLGLARRARQLSRLRKAKPEAGVGTIERLPDGTTRVRATTRRSTGRSQLKTTQDFDIVRDAQGNRFAVESGVAQSRLERPGIIRRRKTENIPEARFSGEGRTTTSIPQKVSKKTVQEKQIGKPAPIQIEEPKTITVTQDIQGVQGFEGRITGALADTPVSQRFLGFSRRRPGEAGDVIKTLAADPSRTFTGPSGTRVERFRSIGEFRDVTKQPRTIDLRKGKDLPGARGGQRRLTQQFRPISGEGLPSPVGARPPQKTVNIIDPTTGAVYRGTSQQAFNQRLARSIERAQKPRQNPIQTSPQTRKPSQTLLEPRKTPTNLEKGIGEAVSQTIERRVARQIPAGQATRKATGLGLATGFISARGSRQQTRAAQRPKQRRQETIQLQKEIPKQANKSGARTATRTLKRPRTTTRTVTTTPNLTPPPTPTTIRTPEQQRTPSRLTTEPQTGTTPFEVNVKKNDEFRKTGFSPTLQGAVRRLRSRLENTPAKKGYISIAGQPVNADLGKGFKQSEKKPYVNVLKQSKARKKSNSGGIL